MIDSNIDMNSSSISRIKALVELYEGSTLVTTCSCADVLQNFTVERYGEDGKFFGSCIGQKLKIELIDLYRVLNITKNYSVKVAYEVGTERVYPYPTFYVDEVVRDEDTNNISVVAYDKLYAAEGLSVADLVLPADNYTMVDVADACAALLGCGIYYRSIPPTTDAALLHVYSSGMNTNGNETVREILKRIAEVLGANCYIGAAADGDEIVFHRLDKYTEPVLTIQKSDYFELKTEAARRLGQLCHTTELGNNIETSLLNEGDETQYIRNNPFLEAIQNETDGDTTLASFLEDTLLPLVAVDSIPITPFYCDWNGNLLLEIGDMIELTTEDDNTVISYVLNNTITYDGTYNEILEWSYDVDETETASNPSSLGEILNKTFAKVDKQAREIELVASTANANSANITSLLLDVEGIRTTVSETTDTLNNTNEKIGELTKSVETKVSADQVSIAIREELDTNGVDKVTTSTGFTFDEEGLTVSKSDSSIATQITEDGMRVYREGQEVLTVDNQGVLAEDLRAITYLIIGSNSRFENYQVNRTACYWIGG